MAYATADEVREWLGLEDLGLDNIFALAIPAAETWVNGYCHRTFELDAVESARYFDAPIIGPLLVDDIGTATVTVATDDRLDGTWSTSWAASDFQLLPANRGFDNRPYYEIAAVGTKTFPMVSTNRTGLVRVTTRWGWPAVPAGVHMACIMKAAQIVSRRNSPNGVAGFNDLGVVRVIMSDSQIADLLADFRLVSVA